MTDKEEGILVAEIPVITRPQVSVLTIIFNLETDKIDIKSFNISKPEVIQLLQKIVMNMTKDLLQESSNEHRNGTDESHPDVESSGNPRDN